MLQVYTVYLLPTIGTYIRVHYTASPLTAVTKADKCDADDDSVLFLPLIHDAKILLTIRRKLKLQQVG